MLPLTVFLGKLLGLYCIVLALAMMSRKQSAVATINAVVRNPPVLMYVSINVLAAGFGMVLGHNIWSGGALPVVVTLLGWSIAIKAVLLLVLPQGALIKVIAVLRYEELFHVYMGVTLVLGLYLVAAAFSA